MDIIYDIRQIGCNKFLFNYTVNSDTPVFVLVFTNPWTAEQKTVTLTTPDGSDGEWIFTIIGACASEENLNRGLIHFNRSGTWSVTVSESGVLIKTINLQVNTFAFELTLEVQSPRFEFDTTNGTDNSSQQIDGTHVINFWSGDGGDGFAQVFEVGCDNLITAAGSAFEFDITQGLRNESCLIDSSHILNLWSGTSNDGFAQIFEVDLSTFEVTALDSPFEFDTSQALGISCCLMDDNHVIVFWEGADNDGFTQVLEINLTTFAVTALDSALEFDTTNGQAHSCQKIDDTHAVNFWSGEDSDGFVQVFEIDSGTFAVTALGTAFEFDTDRALANEACLVDSNHVINFWNGGPGAATGFVRVFEIDLTTFAITGVGTELNFTTSQAAFNSCDQLNSNNFINFWAGEDNDGFLQLFNVNLTTFEVTATDEAIEFDKTNGQWNSAVLMCDKVINFWAGANGDGFALIAIVFI